MSIEKTTLTDKEAVAKLQELHQKERALSEIIMKMKAEQSVTLSSLEQLKSEARQEFGTDNIEELRKMYRTLMEQNSASIIEYEKGIQHASSVVEQIKQSLAELDKAV
jgi:coproporphyrinogen III oxidase-like Fe-S oxidoreductase